MTAAELMVDKEVFKKLQTLPRSVQNRIPRFIEDFRKDPSDPSLRVHPVTEVMKDKKVHGAELPGGYRAILIKPEKGNTWAFVYVDSHDKAYEWAKNRRFEVNRMTGVFQIFDAEYVQEKIEDQVVQFDVGKKYILQSFSSAELIQAGVPEALLPAVNAIDSDDKLEAISSYLPEECRDVLYALAAGYTIDEALEEALGIIVAPKEIENEGDFSQLKNSPSRSLRLVGEEGLELEDILGKSFEEWRLFLHPSQRKIVEWNVKGPMKITGVAGTGKTVALLHRAVYLANKYPKERILFTTFTINLAANIRRQLEGLDTKAAARIDVISLYQLARKVASENGFRGQVPEALEFNGIFREAASLGHIPANWKNEEVVKEYELIVGRNGITQEDDYLSAVRSGRRKIKRADRKELWVVFQGVKNELRKRGYETPDGLVHQARLSLEAKKIKGDVEYRAILVDEAQDFGLEALRLIGALCDLDSSNSLTLAGDGHQRVYGAPVSFSRAGINVRGRSKKLKLNYRTSEQIRRWAHSVLEGFDIDDLDGELENAKGVHSIVSAFEGGAPEIEKCTDVTQEERVVKDWITSLLSNGISEHEICIISEAERISALRDMLDEEFSDTKILTAREADRGILEPGIRLGTMERIKGLEFRAVAICAANDNDPLNNLEEASLNERCMRYVAATRAREHLLVTLRATQ